MSAEPSLLQVVVTVCAVAGAGLGVLNLVRAYLTDSERLRVAVIEGGREEHPGVEVVNVSPFPITVTAVRSARVAGQDVLVELDVKYEAAKLPRRIEARSAHLFPFSMHETMEATLRDYRPRYYYVRTALGNIFTSEPRLTRWGRRILEIVRPS